jgi:DNA polymerase-3 subunit delta
VTPAELERELGSGKFRSAYLLAGTEALLRDDASRAITEAVLADGPRDFNFDRIDGVTCTESQLLDAVRSLPVLAERRLVVLREPEGKGRGLKTLGEGIATAVEELRESSSTVLVVTASTIDKRSKWVKAFREPAALVVCDPPKGLRAIVAFLKQEAKRRQISLQPGAAEALADAVGPQLLMLRQELEKAALHAGPGLPVSRHDVVAVVSDVADEPIWDLTDAIGEGRTPDALAILGRLLDSGARPPALLGSLASHFRKLARLCCGAPVAGHPFMVRKLESQAQRYTRGRLVACLHAIHGVDEALKGQGSLPAHIALEQLVIGLQAPLARGEWRAQ